MAKIYINTVGLVIDVDTGISLAGASEHVLQVRRPNGTTATWSAAIQGSTVLRHVTEPGDIDLPGEYKIQPEIELDGYSGRGSTVTLEVRWYWG